MYQKYRVCASAPAGAFSEPKIATLYSFSTENNSFLYFQDRHWRLLVFGSIWKVSGASPKPNAILRQKVLKSLQFLKESAFWRLLAAAAGGPPVARRWLHGGPGRPNAGDPRNYAKTVKTPTGKLFGE